jgi:hypothetical protein
MSIRTIKYSLIIKLIIQIRLIYETDLLNLINL